MKPFLGDWRRSHLPGVSAQRLRDATARQLYALSDSTRPSKPVDATALIDAVQKLRPESPPSDNLRIALILAIRHGDMPQFANDQDLAAQVQEVVIQLSATADQHAAVAGDLENLAAVSATEYGPDHLWTLVRAIKVQSQIINLYVGPETANC